MSKTHSTPEVLPQELVDRDVQALNELGVVHKATWKGRVWDTLDLQDPKERKMMFKVDAIILTLASVSESDTRGADLAAWLLYQELGSNQCQFGSKYGRVVTTDETDLFQFLSGMKEDLNMHGNELVTAVTLWNVGYVIGQIPINLILTRVDPRWVIPTVSQHLWGRDRSSI